MLSSVLPADNRRRGGARAAHGERVRQALRAPGDGDAGSAEHTAGQRSYRGRGRRRAADGERVEVEAHLTDVRVALADGRHAAAGVHGGGVEVGAVFREAVAAGRRNYIIRIALRERQRMRTLIKSRSRHTCAADTIALGAAPR